jgi:hypothetical protein
VQTMTVATPKVRQWWERQVDKFANIINTDTYVYDALKRGWQKRAAATRQKPFILVERASLHNPPSGAWTDLI